MKADLSIPEELFSLPISEGTGRELIQSMNALNETMKLSVESQSELTGIVNTSDQVHREKQETKERRADNKNQARSFRQSLRQEEASKEVAEEAV